MRSLLRSSIFIVLACAVLFAGCKSSDKSDKKKKPAKPTLYGMKAVFVIANKAFRDEELAEPRKALEDAGVTVKVAAKQKGNCEGMMGAVVNAQLSLDEVNVDQIDALVFVGGGGASTYFDDPQAHKLAGEAAAKKKLVAAICVAPTILAKAGLLSGRDVTAFSSEQGLLEESGAKFQKKAVVFCSKGDFPLLTGADPYVAKQFGQELKARLLAIKKAGKKGSPAGSSAKKDEGSGAKKETPAEKKSAEGSGSK
ncbi:MAG: DJ-1/PfpI family protein [Planctomycetota bacterium]|jgi:protease I